jgi:hypothetical protein
MTLFNDRARRPDSRVVTRAEPAVNAEGLALEPLRGLTSTVSSDPMVLATTLAGAASAMARLDQALAGHPLAQAVLYRTRLESVRRQAAVDGALIDPWHLAASLEGLRLRMDPYLRIIDRGEILDKARTALALHQWIVEPDFDQEGEVQRAGAVLARQPTSLHPLLAAANGFREWIDSGAARAPIRSAMVRSWRKRQLLRVPIPLTGVAALRSDVSWEPALWVPTFLRAIEAEASDGLDLLFTMERTWFEARRGIAGRRKDSHDARAVDLLAAAPVISATTLAAILGIAGKNSIRILDDLVAADIAIEVTHRSKRRLFGLKGLTPLRGVVRPPYRPDPNRGRGRPQLDIEDGPLEATPAVMPPLTPVERKAFDYTALEEAMAHLDAVVRNSRIAMRGIVQGPHKTAAEDAAVPGQE